MPDIATLRIPRSGLPIFRRLASLKAGQRKVLLDLLANDPVRSTGELHSTISQALPGYDDRDVRDVVGQLLGLLSISGSHGYDSAALANYVATSPDLDLPAATRRTFEAFLNGLLAAPGIEGLAKAVDINSERERVLHTSRLITDIRPVFDKSANEPLGAVITHTLRIEYFQGGTIESIEFALADADITSLRESLDREDRKTAAVTKVLQRADVTNFRLTDPDPEDGTE